jgi:hypothetical protein
VPAEKFGIIQCSFVNRIDLFYGSGQLVENALEGNNRSFYSEAMLRRELTAKSKTVDVLSNL